MRDPIAIVESAYACEAQTEAEWLTAVAQAVRSNIESCEGAVAYTYDVRDTGWVNLHATIDLQTPPGFTDALFRFEPDQEAQRALGAFHLKTGLQRGSRMFEGFRVDRKLTDAYADRVLAGRYAEFLVLTATDPGRRGCLVGMPMTAFKPLRSSTLASWRRLTAHIAAGLRLRSRLESLGPGNGSAAADAILTPNGRVEHVTAAAAAARSREALCSAAAVIDRARGPLRRRRPEEALEIWRGLVAGQWSLVDWFDRDGRRYLVAHRNDPEAGDPRGLTERERQVVGYANLGHSNKLIAYELGISSATVRALLSRAEAKLSVSSRDEPRGRQQASRKRHS